MFILFFAQVNALSANEVHVAEDFQIKAVELEKITENNHSLIFKLENKENTVSNIGYSVYLTDPEIKAREYLLFSKRVESLGQNDSRVEEIEFEIPNYFNGSHDLFLEVNDSSGSPLAFNYLGEVSLDGDGQYLEFKKDTCRLTVSGEDDYYSLLQGVDIKKEEEDLFIVCEVENKAARTLTAVPHFDIFLRTLEGEKIKENELFGNSEVLFQAGEIKEIEFRIPDDLPPQAYHASLDFDQASNQVFFHYVIFGESATINKVVLDKDFYKKGEIIKIDYEVSGKASSFNGARNGEDSQFDSAIRGYLELEVKNAEGANCVEKQRFDLADGGREVYELESKLDCPDPQVFTYIYDNDDNLLFEKESLIKSNYANQMEVVSSSEIEAVGAGEEPKANWFDYLIGNRLVIYMGAGGFIILVIVLLIVKFLRARKHKNNIIIKILFLSLFSLSLFFLYNRGVEAFESSEDFMVYLDCNTMTGADTTAECYDPNNCDVGSNRHTWSADAETSQCNSEVLGNFYEGKGQGLPKALYSGEKPTDEDFDNLCVDGVYLGKTMWLPNFAMWYCGSSFCWMNYRTPTSYRDPCWGCMRFEGVMGVTVKGNKIIVANTYLESTECSNAIFWSKIDAEYVWDEGSEEKNIIDIQGKERQIHSGYNKVEFDARGCGNHLIKYTISTRMSRSKNTFEVACDVSDTREGELSFSVPCDVPTPEPECVELDSQEKFSSMEDLFYSQVDVDWSDLCVDSFMVPGYPKQNSEELYVEWYCQDEDGQKMSERCFVPLEEPPSVEPVCKPPTTEQSEISYSSVDQLVENLFGGTLDGGCEEGFMYPGYPKIVGDRWEWKCVDDPDNINKISEVCYLGYNIPKGEFCNSNIENNSAYDSKEILIEEIEVSGCTDGATAANISSNDVTRTVTWSCEEEGFESDLCEARWLEPQLEPECESDFISQTPNDQNTFEDEDELRQNELCKDGEIDNFTFHPGSGWSWECE
ncbi:MAG: hypothetical protein GF347_00885 [Candidatus Moranbacteria bacterium]|nr:hypothetical protein [Candidatus Moranbacteria bacterium]